MHIIDLATALHMSERNFSRVCKEESGLSPGVYYDKFRLEHAKKLLEHSDFTIEEIAIKSGFKSDNVFRKSFEKYLALTPKSYRKLFKQT